MCNTTSVKYPHKAGKLSSSRVNLSGQLIRSAVAKRACLGCESGVPDQYNIEDNIIILQVNL